MKALLIYPFGTSDLQRPDGSRFESIAVAIDETFADDSRAAIRLDVTTRQHRIAIGHSGSMPVLGDTLSFVADALRGRQVDTIDIQPIVTDQREVDDVDPAQRAKDTYRLLPVLRRLDEELALPGGVGVHLLAPWRVARPVDQKDVLTSFAAFLDEYHAAAADYVERFFQLTAGTPQMAFAATVFGGDPDLWFLYTPEKARTVRVAHPQERQRAVTDELVATMAGNCDWAGVVQVLEQRGNGYSPLDGRSHPRDKDIRLGKALSAWSRSQFTTAAAVATADLDPSLQTVTTIARECARQATRREVSTDAAPRRLLCLNAFNRVVEAAVTADPPRVLAECLGFAREWTAWCLAELTGSAQPQLNERQEDALLAFFRLDGVPVGPDYLTWYVLLKRHHDSAKHKLAAAMETFMPLQWALLEARGGRNRLEHQVEDFSGGLGHRQQSLVESIEIGSSADIYRTLASAVREVVEASNLGTGDSFVLDAIGALAPAAHHSTRPWITGAVLALRDCMEAAMRRYDEHSERFRAQLRTNVPRVAQLAMQQALDAFRPLPASLALLRTRPNDPLWNAAEADVFKALWNHGGLRAPNMPLGGLGAKDAQARLRAMANRQP